MGDQDQVVLRDYLVTAKLLYLVYIARSLSLALLQASAMISHRILLREGDEYPAFPDLSGAEPETTSLLMSQLMLSDGLSDLSRSFSHHLRPALAVL
jgi:hypothetical protein